MSDYAQTPTRSLRARHACRQCNSRRVRCDVTERKPCSNCVKSDVECEVVPSRRGRYVRKSKGLEKPATRRRVDATQLSSGAHSSPAADGGADVTLHHPLPGDFPLQAPASPTPAPKTPSVNTFYGESNFLTLMPGSSQRNKDENVDNESRRDADLGPSSSHVVIPHSRDGPEALSFGNPNVSPATLRYLHEEGALTFPELSSCMPAFIAYFERFHPAFPVLDREEIARRISARTLSPILMHSILFIGATYCDDGTITDMGFRDRAEAKYRLYSKARILFQSDWERDHITLIQSLFLISFWRGGPSDVRDVRYWLGIVISLAESQGLHRSVRIVGKATTLGRLRRRIWWSIYVRERQAAASLGLPSRIRDEDCDIEPLEYEDLVTKTPDPEGLPFGACKPEHINYVIKMVEMAKLLGRAIDSYFLPGRSSPQRRDTEDLNAALQSWWAGLPADVSDAHLDNAPVWTCLLHLAFYHLKILIHRSSFLKRKDHHDNNDVTYQAAARISRIAEDMLTNETLRFGQMHLITTLFTALCIHVITIRRSVGASRRIAENRAQACLLSLQEIQKYWRINNNVLDLFMHYVEKSITQQLRGLSDAPSVQAVPAPQQGHAPKNPGHIPEEEPVSGSGWTKPQNGIFEDPHLFMWNGYWDGSDATGDLGMFLTATDFEAGPANFSA